SIAVLAGAVGALAVASPASAQPLSTNTFSYSDMPDLDQQRFMGLDPAGVNHPGLPGNGRMYCGPTAAMDALAFLSDHGMASMKPGRRDWSVATNYETATGHVARMGQLMSTDPVNGTTQANFEAGLLSWAAESGNHYGFVSRFASGDDWGAPNLGIAAFAMAVGNPVILRIGYYTPVVRSEAGRTMVVLKRTGGHWVTMTGFGNEGVTFVDPADTANGFAPSARSHVVQPVSAESGVFTNADDTLQRPRVDSPEGPTFPAETYLRMPGYAGGTAYIEGYTVLQPTFKVTARRGFLKIVTATTQKRVKLPFTAAVDAVKLSPAGDAAFVSAVGRSTVYKVNLATGAATPVSMPTLVQSAPLDGTELVRRPQSVPATGIHAQLGG
ncbi:MAG: hypothetical protein QOG77_533, partial [Solirubrobacteraceae bacterium]|nr:hypothetical protein [Solirubrobacteraceae bacterium]